MSTKKYKGYLKIGHIVNPQFEEVAFDTEDELKDWVAAGDGINRFIQPYDNHESGKFLFKTYRWEQGQVLLETDYFDSEQEALDRATSLLDTHHLIKIYNDQGEMLHELGPLSTSETKS